MSVGQVTNLEAVTGVLNAADVPLTVAALAVTLATELDRQAAAGEDMNAALVQRYIDVLEAIGDAEGAAGEQEPDQLSKLRDAKATGAA